MSHTILIVEDEKAIQELLRINLSLAGFDVLQAYSTEQAIPLINKKIPDLILLDWMLPGVSGVDFAKQLRRNTDTSLVPIIMLTAKSTEENTVYGLNAGADDYITKPFSPKELVARIKALLRRHNPESSNNNTIYAGKLRLDIDRHCVMVNDTKLDIGPTEFKMLYFFMSNQGIVFSRSKIIDHVWGNHVYIEERTVDTHIGRLRKTLQPHDCDSYIKTERGAGYRFNTKL